MDWRRAEIVFVYLVIINIVAAAMYVTDKKAAVQNEWRIPEKRLLLVAAIGGSYGAWFAMKNAHHKMKKPKFVVGVQVMMIIETLVILCMIF